MNTSLFSLLPQKPEFWSDFWGKIAGLGKNSGFSSGGRIPDEMGRRGDRSANDSPVVDGIGRKAIARGQPYKQGGQCLDTAHPTKELICRGARVVRLYDFFNASF
jgi:hypothetical protein